MKYICRECGQTYNKKPNFCDCGNDTFLEGMDDVEPSKERRAQERARRYAKAKAKVKARRTRSENGVALGPLKIFVTLILIALIAFFVPRIIQNQTNEASKRATKEKEATYLDRVMKTVLEDFSPSGITKTDFCIVTFEINESGWISKRAFERRSSVSELNTKVMYTLKKSTIVEKPPEKFANTPLKIRVSCSADEKSAECLSNIYKGTK